MSLQPGMQVGDYQIVRELGAGGMGKVYQVRNVISDRIEAMKVLLPDLVGDSNLADRFLREIKVQAALEHPNIAGLRTAMRDGNQLLMVMEFVEGRTVGEYLEQGTVPLQYAADICAAVLRALDYAHARGIVHRDIKPSNIMITSQGVVKLMDFGIARVMSDPSLTQTHQTTGSLYYMSPEQINGAQLDGRADLYSLAVSLYEMLTGRRPFDGENTFAIMAAHMQQAPVPPVQLDPSIPPRVSDVILKGMAKDPQHRFQSAAAFEEALIRAIQAAPDPVPATEPFPPAPPTPVRRGMAPRTLYMLAGSLGTVLTMALLITQAPRFLRTNAQQPPIEAGAPAAVPQSSPAELGTGIPDTASAGSGAPSAAPVAQRRGDGRGPVGAPAAATAGKILEQQQSGGGITGGAAVDEPQPPQATAPPPAAAAPSPAVTAAPAVDRGALDQQRKRVIQLAQRIATAQAALQSLRESMAQQGLRPRAELQGASQRMQFEMDQAESALNGNNPAGARQHLDNAERALEALEKALNL